MKKCEKPYAECSFGMADTNGFKVVESLESGETVQTEYGICKAPVSGGVYDVYALVKTSGVFQDFKYVRKG